MLMCFDWCLPQCVIFIRFHLFQGLDEQQSVQILECYLQEDYRGTRNTMKVQGPDNAGTHW